jgi:class 3 adenylate cyclase
VEYVEDAAKLVAPDAATLLEVMVELTTEGSVLEDVPLRDGIAAGSTLVREGDIHGSPVNSPGHRRTGPDRYPPGGSGGNP